MGFSIAERGGYKGTSDNPATFALIRAVEGGIVRMMGE